MSESKRAVSAWFVALIGLALVFASAGTAYSELMPYFVSGTTIEQKHDAILSGAFAPGPSFESKFLVLSDCAAVMNSMRRTTDADQNVFRRCFELASGVTSQTPSSSQGWLVQAQAAERLNDMPAFLEALRMSHISSPTEGWLMVERARLAEIRYEQLTPELIAFQSLDMGVLAHTRNGLMWLARLYQAVPATQSRVRAVIDTLPSKIQRSFVSNVAKAAASTNVAP